MKKLHTILLILLSIFILVFVAYFQLRINQLNHSLQMIHENAQEVDNSQEVDTQLEDQEKNTEQPTTDDKTTDTQHRFSIKGLSLYEEKTNGEQMLVVEDMHSLGFDPHVCTTRPSSTLPLWIFYEDNDVVLFDEGCGEVYGPIWRYDIPTKELTIQTYGRPFPNYPSPTGRYQVTFETAESEGANETLRVTDFLLDKQEVIDTLPADLSYIELIGEFAGEPHASVRWLGEKNFEIDIFLSSVPVDELFSRRQPVLTKQFNLYSF